MFLGSRFCSLPGHLPIEEESLTAKRCWSLQKPLARPRLRSADLCGIIWRRRKFIAAIEGSLLLACLLYCLIVPNQYEAAARVELRTAPASSLSLDPAETSASSSILSAPIAQETLADVLRSDRLAWRVITDLKLYQAPGFHRQIRQQASRLPSREAIALCTSVAARTIFAAAACGSDAAHSPGRGPVPMPRRCALGRGGQRTYRASIARRKPTLRFRPRRRRRTGSALNWLN